MSSWALEVAAQTSGEEGLGTELPGETAAPPDEVLSDKEPDAEVQQVPTIVARARLEETADYPPFWQPDPSAVRLGLWQSARSVPLESLGLIALVTYTGFKDWKWGTASFRFNSEGWFGMDTGSGGVDKTGHMYGAYMSSELLYWRLRASHHDRRVLSVYPAVFATLLYLYIEMFDGYSVDHGFSYEDVIMNTSGILFSLARNSFPVVRRGLDYRLEYYPSKNFNFHPVIDYEGQKFMGVFKMAVFPALARSPARFLEFLVGYYTRGFAKDLDVPFKTSHLFFGVGVSPEQLLFKPLNEVYGEPFEFLGLASNYFQLPYTYISAEHTRTAPTRK